MNDDGRTRECMSHILHYVIVATRDNQSRWFFALDEDHRGGGEFFTVHASSAKVYASEADAALEISKRNTDRFWKVASGVDDAHPVRSVEVGVEAITAVQVGIKLMRRYTERGVNHNAFT